MYLLSLAQDNLYYIDNVHNINPSTIVNISFEIHNFDQNGTTHEFMSSSNWLVDLYNYVLAIHKQGEKKMKKEEKIRV